MQPLIAIPLTLLLILRAYTRRSLTPVGILFAALTALVHSLHPSPLPFTLLCVFFLAGTTATKVHHQTKATLTLSSSSGATGAEGPRTHVQVLANSACASLLCLLHVWTRGWGTATEYSGSNGSICRGFGNDVLLAGIVANYAAVAADTLSSELGILAKSQPRLVTALMHQVPRGTNGGVTLEGFLAGCLGALVIGVASVLVGTFCPPEQQGPLAKVRGLGGNTQTDTGPQSMSKVNILVAITVWGALGSLLDSVLGATLQASVVDRRTGKVVEGSGGVKVLTSSAHHHESTTALQSRKKNVDVTATATPVEKEKNKRDESGGGSSSRLIVAGRDLLDNNQINFLMASIMTIGAMFISALSWRIPLSEILS